MTSGRSHRTAPRADEDDVAATFLGTGQLHALSENDEPDPPPSIWLPMHRSGSRFGGWRRVAVATTRPIGFRRP